MTGVPGCRTRTHESQWRDRAGVAPASSLSVTTEFGVAANCDDEADRTSTDGGVVRLRRVPTTPLPPYAVGSPSARGSRDDRCPGSIRLHAAADGSVARVRLAGRSLSVGQIVGIGCLATELGDGGVRVTSRANVQLRGLAVDDGPRLAARLHDLGLLPSESHERVRNVVAAPFGGPGVETVAATLDEAICAEPVLAGLSGRFLFGVELAPDPMDDGTPRPDQPGRGNASDLVDQPVDVVVRSLADVPHAVALARAFVAVAAGLDPRPWQVRELDDPGRARLRVAAGDAAYGLVRDTRLVRHTALDRDTALGRREPGLLVDDAGRLVVQVLAPLGRVPAAALLALTDHVTTAGARVTPWRSVVLPVADAAHAGALLAALAESGWVTDPHHPLVGHTACTGRPGCASARSDVHADALRLAVPATRSTPVHWSGCERRCGHPTTLFVDQLATAPSTYQTEQRDGRP